MSGNTTPQDAVAALDAALSQCEVLGAPGVRDQCTCKQCEHLDRFHDSIGEPHACIHCAWLSTLDREATLTAAARELWQALYETRKAALYTLPSHRALLDKHADLIKEPNA